MILYLAIDPGAKPGYAVLNANLQLVWCGIEEPDTFGGMRVVLCERPTIYPKSKVDPSNIITLALTAGGQTDFWARQGARIEWVEPRTWKGNIPKAIHHAAILHSLSPGEQDVVARCLKGVSPTRREDAMDAVGLAVYGRKMRLFQ